MVSVVDRICEALQVPIYEVMEKTCALNGNGSEGEKGSDTKLSEEAYMTSQVR